MRHHAFSQPGSSLTLVGGDISRAMVGAWFFSSPGIGGRIHNHAPQPSSLTQSAAVVHAIINNPYASNGWRNQHDGISLENSDNVSEASGTWVDLGDPIATADDVTALVGWIPVATTVPSGTNVGTFMVRGQDGSGNGWNYFLRHDGTNQITCAVVTTSAGTVQFSAIGTNAGIRPGIPNFCAGRWKAGSNVAVACNGRMLTQTNTATTSLRTSTKGCRLGTQTSAASTSHCDPMLFCILWRRALTDPEMQYLTAQPWVLWTIPDLTSDMVPPPPGSMAGTITLSLGLSGDPLSTSIPLAVQIPIAVNPAAALTNSIQLASVIPINVAMQPDLKASKLGRALKNCGHPMFTKCERLHLGEES